MKHLKLFETVAQYESFKNGSDFVLPNVSYCQDVKSVWYNNSFIEPTGSYIAVDLGLPSGRLWADRNVGAASPEDAGLYFQWGDTVGYTAEQVDAGEKTFNWSNYFDTNDNYGFEFNKYATNKLTVLETVDDAANVNMGSNWRMPTTDEYEELVNNTTVTFIDLDGNEFTRDEIWAGDSSISEDNLKGVKFTGSNGNSIFIPAAGYCLETTFDGNCTGGVWSSSLSSSDSAYAGSIGFYCNGNFSIDYMSNRFYGFSVRGVCN